MSLPVVLAVARRVLAQFRGDPRTVALLLGVPPALATLLWLVLDNEVMFARVGPQLVAIFPFTTMFLVTSITMLRERTSGTLERLMTLPVSRGDLLGGYQLAFGIAATVQATITAAIALGPLGLNVAGSSLALIASAIVVAQLGTALGLLVSAFARTEFQAVQFLPLTILPQFLLCGVIVPVDQMRSPVRQVQIARVKQPPRLGRFGADRDFFFAGEDPPLRTEFEDRHRWTPGHRS